jgi:polyphenol oxidase
VRFVEQVHGDAVALVGELAVADPPRTLPARSSGRADALVTSASSSALAILVADCAPIALASPEGVFGAVHAGWRGIAAEVVEHAVRAMREQGASTVTAVRGPCIRACCYQFSDEDLERVAAVRGPSVRGRTAAGAPALDLPAAVSAALAAAEVTEGAGVDRCTACGGGYFSHRARGDTGRQALFVWRSAEGDPVARSDGR